MNSLSKTEQWKNFSFVMPALAIFTFFYIIPFFYIFWLALHKASPTNVLDFSFVGFENFKEIFTQDIGWWKSVGRSFYIVLWALSFQNILAFFLAIAVDKAIRTGKIYRIIFFLLPILSEVIIGLLLRILLKDYPGVFNYFLGKLGLAELARSWLGKDMALATLAVAHCWRGFGWGFVILLAGLQTIPEQLYEAARVDGANAIQKFFRITVPLLMPMIFLVVILTILGTMQVIGLPMALTRGGPANKTTVAVLRIYNDLNNSHPGYASAEGLVLGVILVTMSFFLIRLSKRLKPT